MDASSIVFLLIGIFIAVYGGILLAGRKLDQERRNKNNNNQE